MQRKRRSTWVFLVRGLVPGFEYEVHFEWSVAGDENAPGAQLLALLVKKYAC
jgi:hypothetical protein